MYFKINNLIWNGTTIDNLKSIQLICSFERAKMKRKKQLLSATIKIRLLY